MKSQNKKYWSYICILFIFYIGLAILQYSTEEETLSFFVISIFLFILSLLIGLFIQKIQSRQEFQEQLHSKAIASIRRLNDIENLVKRGLANTPENTNDFSNTLFNIINESVISAIFDWADVLEEDFKKIQELENKKIALITELRHKSKDPEEGKKQILELRQDISRLQKTIPQELYSSVYEKIVMEIGTYQNQELLNFFAGSNPEYEIRIEVFDSELYTIVEKNEPLNIQYSNIDEKIGLFVVSRDDNKSPLGKVNNKFANGVIHNSLYYDWLITALYNFRINELIVLDEYAYQRNPTNKRKEILIKIPTSRLFFVHG
jgi:hypothetical protein